MATNRWTARDGKTAQVNTATPALVSAGDTFTLTINLKTLTFTSVAGTVAEVTAGLIALWNAETEGEMEEVTAADGTTVLTLTADTEGVPFTQTSSSVGGTLVTATTTANLSPNDATNANNWSDGVPNAADDVVLDAGGADESLWWNLGSLSAVTLTSFTRRRSFTGKIGLPEFNADGAHSYFEYRATELAVSATTMTIEQPGSDEAEHVKVNVGTVQTALTVLGDGPSGLGDERMWWRGTHASNVVNVVNGSLAAGVANLNPYTIATLRVEGGTFRGGSAGTLTTVSVIESTLELNCGCTTLAIRGGGSVVTTKGTAVITTADVYEGTLIPISNSTIGTIVLGARGVIDWSQGTGTVIVTNQVTFPAGCTWKDPEGRVTLSGGYKYADGVRQKDCDVDMGTGRTHTVS